VQEGKRKAFIGAADERIFGTRKRENLVAKRLVK